jgi:aspartate aminotransferase
MVIGKLITMAKHVVAPAAGFYSTPGVGLNQVRIAYCVEEGRLDQSRKIFKRSNCGI